MKVKPRKWCYVLIHDDDEASDKSARSVACMVHDGSTVLFGWLDSRRLGVQSFFNN